MEDPTKAKVVIPVQDEAIDWEAMAARDPDAMKNYRTDYDASRIVLTPGEKCERYTVRALTRTERREVRRLADDSDQYELAFRYGFVRVDDGRFMNGARGPYARPTDEAASARPMPEEDLDRFIPSVVLEVGSVIWRRSFLSPFSAACLPLPDISLRALTSRTFRRSPAEPTSGSSPSASASEQAEDEAPSPATP